MNGSGKELRKSIVNLIRNPSYSVKKMEEDYNINQYYKTFNRKFDLPNIIQAGKAVYNKCDTSIFMRSFREDTELSKIKTKYTDDEENVQNYETRNQTTSQISTELGNNFY